MKLPILPALLFWGLALSPALLPALGKSEGSIQKTWDYPAGVAVLSVDADRQDIVIKAGGSRLTGRYIGDSGDDVKVTRQGDTVTITARSDHGWFSRKQRSSRIEVTVPKGLSLDLTTASGAILVEAPTQGLKARSASGDIEAPQGGTEADADSASGTVRLRGFTGPVRASALSGDLLLEDLSGDIQASSMSGSIEGTHLAPAQGSRFTSVSGDVRLELKGGAGDYRLRTESVSGDLRIGRQKGEHNLDAGSSGPSVTAKTVSGDVRIE